MIFLGFSLFAKKCLLKPCRFCAIDRTCLLAYTPIEPPENPGLPPYQNYSPSATRFFIKAWQKRGCAAEAACGGFARLAALGALPPFT